MEAAGRDKKKYWCCLPIHDYTSGSKRSVHVESGTLSSFLVTLCLPHIGVTKFITLHSSGNILQSVNGTSIPEGFLLQKLCFDVLAFGIVS